MGLNSSVQGHIDSIRETLRKVEEAAGVSPDEWGLLELKRILLNRIDELDRTARQAPTQEDKTPCCVARGAL